ncbi:hypothetical protein LEP1GSC202_0731 [Leptospira yanagawae serovar Saopaulo str. Sao Paulo = ATCC 700523]|uniref:Uncharacterized protein n=1 Tax=Leptospira yanagawae serovar Saopaulo str. Sao Paulo = ATCC 700523 TaxID=1249483 RepID=A0A5E8HFH1_9LEPT|nr:hypothetical protein LEP1GSC202_0731 [Leptospira yanagawae serovar Saopaulo str. Sao Paulo = ATCC 700523]
MKEGSPTFRPKKIFLHYHIYRSITAENRFRPEKIIIF